MSCNENELPQVSIDLTWGSGRVKAPVGVIVLIDYEEKLLHQETASKEKKDEKSNNHLHVP